MTETLHAKFGTLETQIAANHTELMNALNTIAYALGAPPSAPTITLATVVAAIEASNTLLTATNALLTAGNAITAGIRTDLNSQLDSIGLQLDTANNNASTNTQALLAALYATFCGCSTGAPLLPPILDVTPTPLEPDVKCQRIQYYMSIFTSWLSKVASYTAATGGITADVVGALLALAATEAGLVAAGAEVGAVLGPPGVVIGAIVTAIAGAVYLLGSSFLNDYIIDFNSPIFQQALLEALYAANSAEEGQAAFESVVTANFATVPAGILALLWWSQWSNDMYSNVPIIDASAFDSTICAPEDNELVMVVPTSGCRSAQSVLATMGDSTTLQVIDWSPGATSNVVDGSLTQTSDKRVWGLTDLFGLWVYSVPDCHAYLDATGFPNMGITSTPQQIPVHTNNRYSFLTGSTPFTLVICVDEPEV